MQKEPPYDGGSQPVPQQPPEVPGPGRSAMHIVVMVVAALVILGSVMWVIR